MFKTNIKRMARGVAGIVALGAMTLAPLAFAATPASASPKQVVVGVLSCPEGGQLAHASDKCGAFSAGVGTSYAATFTPRASGNVVGVLSCPKGGQLAHASDKCGAFSAGVGTSYAATFTFIKYVSKPLTHTILCAHGKKILRVGGVSPRCPVGFVKK